MTQTKYRAYAAQPDGGDPHAAGGACLAALMLALRHGEALGELRGSLDGERSYAEGHAGQVLAQSRSNPAVRRWISLRAAAHRRTNHKLLGRHALAGLAGHLLAGPHAGGAGVVASLLHVQHDRREQARLGEDSAFSHRHYLAKHARFVKKAAQDHGLHEHEVAHALAHLADAEHRLSRKPGGVRGQVGADDYHRHLAGEAKKGFTDGVASILAYHRKEDG